MEYTLRDESNELGFGEDAEILIDMDYTCTAGSPPGWEDPGCDPECNISGWSVMHILSSDNEEINWTTLSPEKQKEIDNWLDDKVNTNEVYEDCFQHESDYWEDYKADMYDRRYG